MTTHRLSQTFNIQLVKTTLPLSHANPLVAVTNTLIIYKASDVDTFNSTKLYWQDANKHLGEGMDNRFYPLILPDKFLNKYLLLDNAELVCLETNWLEIHTRIKEVGMYLLFVSIILYSCQPAHTEI